MKRFTRPAKRSLWFIPLVFYTFLGMPFTISGQSTDCKEVFISEYVDGVGKNKVLELFNPTDTPIDLLGYSVVVYYDGATEPTGIHLTGAIPEKGVYVLAFDEADASLRDSADQVSPDFHPDGNDAIELLKQSAVLDVIGEPGINPGPGGWTVGNGTTSNHTLVRQVQCKRGETDWAIGQNQWATFANQQTSGLGDHIGICRNAGGYTVEVIQGLAASYPEDYCTGTPCIEIIVQVSPPVTFPDNVFVEIDENTVCPSGARTTPFDDNFFNNNTVVLQFVDGGSNTQSFDLHIVDDAIDEMDENLCLIVTATPNTCINCVLNTVIVDNDMVGIEQLMAGTSLEISPNPASESLILRNLPGIKKIEIFTIHGRQVLPEIANLGNGVEVSVSNLVGGVYFLRFEYKGQGFTYKFVKQ